jgi:hypothetical protein
MIMVKSSASFLLLFSFFSFFSFVVLLFSFFPVATSTDAKTRVTSDSGGHGAM